MLQKFAARDAGLIAFTLFAWWLAAERSLGLGPVGDFFGFTIGVLMGACAYVLHEWGHWLAGYLVGSKMSINHNLASGFMFSYDARDNSLGQFVVMSIGGFIATALVVIAYYRFLPDPLLATRVARGAVLFLVFLTATLEIPLLALAIVKGSVPGRAAVKVS